MADACPNKNFTGIIVRNASAINLATRTLNVGVGVHNLEHELLPGQYAFTQLSLAAASAGLSMSANGLIF